MGKRKSRKIIRRAALPSLAKEFDCPFCHGTKCISIKFNGAEKTAQLACRICDAAYSTSINSLSEAVDVYGEWIDECLAANNPIAAADDTSALYGSSGRSYPDDTSSRAFHSNPVGANLSQSQRSKRKVLAGADPSGRKRRKKSHHKSRSSSSHQRRGSLNSLGGNSSNNSDLDDEDDLGSSAGEELEALRDIENSAAASRLISASSAAEHKRSSRRLQDRIEQQGVRRYKDGDEEEEEEDWLLDASPQSSAEPQQFEEPSSDGHEGDGGGGGGGGSESEESGSGRFVPAAKSRDVDGVLSDLESYTNEIDTAAAVEGEVGGGIEIGDVNSSEYEVEETRGSGDAPSKLNSAEREAVGHNVTALPTDFNHLEILRSSDEGDSDRKESFVVDTAEVYSTTSGDGAGISVPDEARDSGTQKTVVESDVSSIGLVADTGVVVVVSHEKSGTAGGHSRHQSIIGETVTGANDNEGFREKIEEEDIPVRTGVDRSEELAAVAGESLSEHQPPQEEELKYVASEIPSSTTSSPIAAAAIPVDQSNLVSIVVKESPDEQSHSGSVIEGYDTTIMPISMAPTLITAGGNVHSDYNTGGVSSEVNSIDHVINSYKAYTDRPSNHDVGNSSQLRSRLIKGLPI